MKSKIVMESAHAGRLMRIAADRALCDNATYGEAEGAVIILGHYIAYANAFTRGYVAGKIDKWLEDPARSNHELEGLWKEVRELCTWE